MGVHGQSNELPLNAIVARAMLAEDARWAIDLIRSSESTPLMGVVGLTFARHFVRIVHEGRELLASQEAPPGLPDIAHLLRDNHPDIDARVRSAIKLTDDTATNVGDISDRLVETARSHSESLKAQTRVSVLRALGRDLGFHTVDGRPVVATVSTGLLLGINPMLPNFQHGEPIQELTQEWSHNLLVMSAALDATVPNERTLSLASIAVGFRDVHWKQYVDARFGRDFPRGLSLLLLAVEAEVGVATALLPACATGYPGTDFRLRTITAYHAARALLAVSNESPVASEGRLPTLRDRLSTIGTDRVVSSGGRLVRNRCTHYMFNDPAISVDLARPMFGLIEGVFPSQSYERHDSDVDRTLESISAFFAEDVPRR
jgi:hypothetical protein